MNFGVIQELKTTSKSYLRLDESLVLTAKDSLSLLDNNGKLVKQLKIDAKNGLHSTDFYSHSDHKVFKNKEVVAEYKARIKNVCFIDELIVIFENSFIKGSKEVECGNIVFVGDNYVLVEKDDCFYLNNFIEESKLCKSCKLVDFDYNKKEAILTLDGIHVEGEFIPTLVSKTAKVLVFDQIVCVLCQENDVFINVFDLKYKKLVNKTKVYDGKVGSMDFKVHENNFFITVTTTETTLLKVDFEIKKIGLFDLLAKSQSDLMIVHALPLKETQKSIRNWSEKINSFKHTDEEYIKKLEYFQGKVNDFEILFYEWVKFKSVSLKNFRVDVSKPGKSIKDLPFIELTGVDRLLEKCLRSDDFWPSQVVLYLIKSGSASGIKP